jgi:hypothetical protein
MNIMNPLTASREFKGSQYHLVMIAFMIVTLFLHHDLTYALSGHGATESPLTPINQNKAVCNRRFSHHQINPAIEFFVT